MILGQEEKPPLDQLAHYGVKGMKWGVRKAEDSGSRSTSHPKREMSNKKKAAIIAGSVASAAVLAAGAYYISKHSGVSLDEVGRFVNSKSAEPAKKFTESVVKEPAGILHSARGLNKGYAFHQRGGLSDPESEFIKAGFGDGSSDGFFNRYGDRLEKVAATFNDPEGRHDFAGRRVVHDIVLPEHMAKGVTSAKDVEQLSWPLIKDTFHSFYESSREKR